MIEEITDLTLRGRGPAEILKLLTDDKRFRGRVPQIRTVKKYAGLAKRGTVSEPWRLVDAPADEVALVVPVIAAVIERSEGRVREISKPEASVVARIVRAAPDVPPWDAYRLARRLLADPDADRDVQEFLSFEPWTPDGRARYDAAFRARWVRHRLLPGFSAGPEIQRYETPEEAMTTEPDGPAEGDEG